MAFTLNKFRLDNLLRGIQQSIKTFEAQGHAAVYFTAQFFCAGKRQNGIERGDLRTFNKQMRYYVISEEAESARIEFFNEATGKLIYSKALTGLRKSKNAIIGTNSGNAASEDADANGNPSIAEMLEEADRRFEEQKRDDAFQSLSKEVVELRSKNDELVSKNNALEASLQSKSGLEFYSGVIGTALPGLATTLKGTRLEKAADFLFGASKGKSDATPTSEPANDGAGNMTSMVNELYSTLNEQEAGAIHLLFMAFAADHNKIKKALQCIATET